MTNVPVLSRTNCQRLPGVYAVGVVDASALPQNIMLRALARLPIIINQSISWVPITGEAECLSTTEYDNNVPMETVTLSFQSVHPLAKGLNPAFVVVTTEMDAYLIGQLESPRIELKCESTTGSPSGSPSVYNFTVTHKCCKALKKCVL